MDLPSIKYTDIKKAVAPLRELLDEKGPHIVTADSIEVFVVMTLENYYAWLPVKPGRQARMLREKGVLYREVI